MTQLLLTELVAKLDTPLCAALERAAGSALSSGSDSIEIEQDLPLAFKHSLKIFG